MNHQINVSLPQLDGDALPSIEGDVFEPSFHYEVKNTLPLHPKSCGHGAIEKARDFRHLVLCNASLSFLKKQQIILLVELDRSLTFTIRLDLIVVLLTRDCPLLKVF